jgi:hypothetical protein
MRKLTSFYYSSVIIFHPQKKPRVLTEHISIVICYISYLKTKDKLIYASSAINLSFEIDRDMTHKCSVMSSYFASALPSIRIFRSPS